MKVYVVTEYAVIGYEECTQVMGVFSSVDKAKEAIEDYEDIAELYEEDYEYNYEEFNLDTVWTETSEEDEEDEDDT